MKITYQKSINYHVWSQGIFWAILGVVWANHGDYPSIFAVIGSILSMLLLLGLLVWTGKVLAQLSATNVPEKTKRAESSGRISSPYYQITRSQDD